MRLMFGFSGMFVAKSAYAMDVRTWTLTLALVVSIAIAGCGGPYKEPTIEKFDGQLTHEGQPISFADGEKVLLRLTLHKNGERFGVPISPAGTFDIGWMPIGEYSATLERGGSASGFGVDLYNIDEGLTIAEGQTKYTVELGEKFKP